MKLSEFCEDVYTRLTDSSALTTIIGEGRIFDCNPLPPPEKGPYVVIGDATTDEGRLLSDAERVVYITLHLWSSYKGRKELIDMEQAIEAVFMGAPTVYYFESFNVMRDIEEGWTHGVLTFRAYIDRGFEV